MGASPAAAPAPRASVRLRVQAWLARLLRAFGVVLGLTVALGIVLALARGGGVRQSLELACYVVGALVLVVAGASGPQHPRRARAEETRAGPASAEGGRPPGRLGPAPPPALVLVAAGAILLALGWALSEAG